MDREISGRQTGERWSSQLKGIGSSISRAEPDDTEDRGKLETTLKQARNNTEAARNNTKATRNNTEA